MNQQQPIKSTIIRVGQTEPVVTGFVFMDAQAVLSFPERGPVLFGGYTQVELEEVVNEHGENKWLHVLSSLGGECGKSIAVLGVE